MIEGWNGGSPYVTKTPNSANGGKFIKISDYTIQSGQGGNGACTASQIMPIGTVAHETGHAFGLPDLYDTQGGTEGIGEWGLMGVGQYARPYSPSRMEGWSMLELGWVKADTLTDHRHHHAEPGSHLGHRSDSEDPDAPASTSSWRTGRRSRAIPPR